MRQMTQHQTLCGKYGADMRVSDSEGAYKLHLGKHASVLEAATVAAAARYALRGKASPLLRVEQYEQHPLVQRLRQLPRGAGREVVRAAANKVLGVWRNDKTNLSSTVYVGVLRPANTGTYEATVEHDRKRYCFSGHSTPEQAAHTYNVLALRAHGDKAQRNDLTGMQLQPPPAELQAVLARSDLRGGHELLEAAVNARRRSFKTQSSSKYQGVYKAGGRWQVKIFVKPQSHHLGYYSSELAAARAYDRVLIQQGLVGKLHRRLNYPEAEYAGDPLLAEWSGRPIKQVTKRCLQEADREEGGEACTTD